MSDYHPFVPPMGKARYFGLTHSVRGRRCRRCAISRNCGVMRQRVACAARRNVRNTLGGGPCSARVMSMTRGLLGAVLLVAAAWAPPAAAQAPAESKGGQIRIVY